MINVDKRKATDFELQQQQFFCQGSNSVFPKLQRIVIDTKFLTSLVPSLPLFCGYWGLPNFSPLAVQN